MKTVLLVDDEKLFLASLTEGLASYGGNFNILTANNGKQAIEILNSQTVDLIVTDLKMPVMDGFHLLLYLMKENFNIPVIVMTAFGTPEIEKQLKEFQTFGYLEKPVDVQKLADKINEGLAKAQSGSLNGISLFSFLQLIHVEQKTCQLKVKAPGQNGTLYFFKGELFDAAKGDLRGEEAALEIVCWEEVEIEVVNMFKKVKQQIFKPLQNILMDAAKIKDELSLEKEAFGQEANSKNPVEASSEEPTREIEGLMIEQSQSNQKQKDSSVSMTENSINEKQNTNIKGVELSMANNVKESLDKLMEIEGAKAAMLVDLNSGMPLGTAGGGINFDIAAAGNTEVVKEKMKVAAGLGLKDSIEDILITLDTQYHLIRPLNSHKNLFFYMTLNRANSNLAMARFKLTEVERQVQV